jgi:protein-tyrosine phosphatase
MDLISIKKNPTFDHIIDNIFLGCIDSTNDEFLVPNNIKIIINISNIKYTKNPNIIYYDFEIDDDRNIDISIFFNQTIGIIKNNPGLNILIHCANAVSRSVSLVLTYLLEKMNLKDALIYLKSKRNQYTKPNIGFAKQLIIYEKEKYNTNSLNLKEFIFLCSFNYLQ